MTCLSRSVLYVLFLLSSALSTVLARPLALVTDLQVKKSTTNTGQVSARTSRFSFASDTCNTRALRLIQVY